MVGLRGAHPVEDRVADVEEAGAARSAQELASRGRQEVAADRLDVEVELADRLARVDQERHPGRPGQRADLGRRVHQPAVRRHVGERHQRHVAATRARRPSPRPTPARTRRSAPARRRPRTPRPHAGRRPCSRRTRDRGRGCAAPPPSAPTRTPRSTPPSHVSKRAISCGRAPIRRPIDPYTASRSPARSAADLVPAVGRLAPQVLHLRVDDRPRWQRRAGVVQVDLIESGAQPGVSALACSISSSVERSAAITAAGRPLRAARSRPPRSAPGGCRTRCSATSAAGVSNSIACTIGWISDDACWPMMWAPMISPVSTSTSTLANDVVSTSAHPYAVPA